jgi:hypothetical protein
LYDSIFLKHKTISKLKKLFISKKSIYLNIIFLRVLTLLDIFRLIKLLNYNNLDNISSSVKYEQNISIDNCNTNYIS